MTLIQQLSEGKIAVENTGTFEELKKVLKAAFPKDPYKNFEESGRHLSKYFYEQLANGGLWINSNSTDLPSHPISDFIKELDNQTTTMRTITPEQAQSIIDIACETWKEKLSTVWATAIVLKRSINIDDTFYQNMRKACTDAQHQLFDTIFGKDIKYKAGDWVDISPKTETWNAIVRLISIDKDVATAITRDGKEASFSIEAIKKLATPEEIKKAQYLPKGTPCFVRSATNNYWKLVYADGNGAFYYASKKSGDTCTWEQVRKYSDGLPEE